MPTIDQLIKQAKAGIKSTPSAPADNTRYGEMSGVKTRSIPKIASDLIVNTAKKRYSQLTTNGPDSVFPDPKKYPQEALERGLNWAYAMTGDLSKVVVRSPKNFSKIIDCATDVPAKSSTQLKLNSPNTVPLPPSTKNARDYINMARSMAPVRDGFVADDIVRGMSSRGEKFVGTINSYPKIPVGSKFSENIGTGGQNEGPGFYSATFGSDTPSYYSYWNQRDKGSNVLGENLILSKGDFNIGGTGKEIPSLDRVMDFIRDADLPIGHKQKELAVLKRALENTVPYQFNSSSPLHVLRMAKEKMPVNEAEMRVRNWASFAHQIREAGSEQPIESSGLDYGEMNDMLSKQYHTNPIFREFIDNKTDREITDMIYRKQLPDGMPEGLRDTIRNLISKATKLYKGDIRRSVSLAKRSSSIENSLLNKAYNAQKVAKISKENALYKSRFDNINYVTSPDNTFPISRVDGMIDGAELANPNINAASAYRGKLNDVLRGGGKYPVAYDIRGENSPATIIGWSGYPHTLSSNVIDRLKKTDRYVTGKEAVMHSIKNLMSLYGE